MDEKEIDLYPLDADGYAQSFNDIDQWHQITSKYGVLVVPVLNESECDIVIKDLWTSFGPNISSDYRTWDTKNWPNPDHPFLNVNYATSEQAFLTRTHPNIIRVFENLYHTRKLLTTIDYYGVKRSTIMMNGEIRDDWRTKPLRLHWDTDIIQYVEDQKRKKIRYQALLALNDNTQETGSFACVPCSSKLLEKWLSYYEKPEGKKYVPMNNPWQKHIQRLPLRKGHMIVWDVGTAHANFSNYSVEPRLNMYCRMIPNEAWAIARERQAITHFWKMNPSVKKEVMNFRKWTKLQKELIGLK